MEFTQLPKDIQILLALDLDIETIIRLCQTSEIVNKKICKNNNFWLNKLLKDYNIRKPLKDAKKEYLRIDNLVKNYPNLFLEGGIETENFNMVKKSIEFGADPNSNLNGTYPISEALGFKSPEILNYLVEKSIDNTSLKIIVSLLNTVQEGGKEQRCMKFLRFYETFLPALSKTNEYKKDKYKGFWTAVLSKFEEVYRTEDCIKDTAYKNLKPLYVKMTE